MDMEPVEVRCYSGATYAERPIAFLWQGRWWQVREVQRYWVEPGGRYFRVVAEDGRAFQLRYDPQGDVWHLKPQ